MTISAEPLLDENETNSRTLNQPKPSTYHKSMSLSSKLRSKVKLILAILPGSRTLVLTEISSNCKKKVKLLSVQT